jgi:hypothetical protein
VATAFVAKGNEVSLVRVNAQATVCHPVDDYIKVGSNKVGRLLVVMGNCNQGTIVHIQLGSTVDPPFCQMEEGSSVDGRQDGR